MKCGQRAEFEFQAYGSLRLDPESFLFGGLLSPKVALGIWGPVTVRSGILEE